MEAVEMQVYTSDTGVNSTEEKIQDTSFLPKMVPNPMYQKGGDSVYDGYTSVNAETDGDGYLYTVPFASTSRYDFLDAAANREAHDQQDMTSNDFDGNRQIKKVVRPTSRMMHSGLENENYIRPMDDFLDGNGYSDSTEKVYRRVGVSNGPGGYI